MQGKELHDFLFGMYDFADYLASQIQPDNRDNGNYFLTLIYIEKIMDKYGRGLVFESAKADPQTIGKAEESLSLAHKRIDELRRKIDLLRKQYDFGSDIERDVTQTRLLYGLTSKNNAQ